MYSVPMALADFIPVFLFGMASVILQHDLHNMAGRAGYSVFCTGTADVFMAGFCKALYKFLYAAGICDFQVLSKMFFPLQAFGFMLSGIGMLLIVFRRKKQEKLCAAGAVPAVYSGTFIFVGLMIAGLGCMYTGLGILAKRLKKPGTIALFAFSFVSSMMMGYLSSKDFTLSYMNWMAELVNISAQLTLFLGVYILHKAGLEQFRSCDK